MVYIYVCLLIKAIAYNQEIILFFILTCSGIKGIPVGPGEFRSRFGIQYAALGIFSLTVIGKSIPDPLMGVIIQTGVIFVE